MVHVFKNWKLLFENFYGNTCGWKSVLKYVKCCLKTENCCLKTLTKHPLILSFFLLTSANVFSMAHGNLTPHSNTYILLNLASYKIEIILCSPWPMGMHLQPYTAAQHNIYIYIYIFRVGVISGYSGWIFSPSHILGDTHPGSFFLKKNIKYFYCVSKS